VPLHASTLPARPARPRLVLAPPLLTDEPAPVTPTASLPALGFLSLVCTEQSPALTDATLDAVVSPAIESVASPATSTRSCSLSPQIDSPLSVPPPVPTGPVTRRQRGIVQPKIRNDGTVAWSSVLDAHVASKDTFEPRDYKEALRIPHWRTAMETEYSAL
jgi:hypothetical protein